MLRFTLSYGDSIFDLPLGETTVGRGLRCAIRFSDPSISRQHARFLVRGHQILVEDLQSANGTRVNGQPVLGAELLHDGDYLDIGFTRLRVAIEDEEAFDARDTMEEIPRFDFSEVVEEESWRRVVTAVVEIPETAGQDPGAERRLHLRVTNQLRATYDSETCSLDATAANVSTGGLFLRCDLLDAVGTRCEVTLNVGERPVRLVGRVRHVVDNQDDGSGLGCGMGIEFDGLSPGDRRRLEQLVTQTLTT